MRVLEGAVLDAERLWGLGVLHHRVEDGHALEEALAVARRIVAGAHAGRVGLLSLLMAVQSLQPRKAYSVAETQLPIG